MDKTIHENLCQFTLTVKNAFGDPVLGYASFVNAAFSNSKDGPSTPLQVHEAGNGKYMFLIVANRSVMNVTIHWNTHH